MHQDDRNVQPCKGSTVFKALCTVEKSKNVNIFYRETGGFFCKPQLLLKENKKCGDYMYSVPVEQVGVPFDNMRQPLIIF